MSTLHVAPTHIFKNTAPRALRSMAVALALLSVSFPVGAQSNVRAWSADGQVFVVWQNAATAPLTYDIYRSAAPITSTSQGTLAGRVFEPEWSGERLKLASPTARWRVPTSNGGTYQLAGGEGLFVYTPRAASTEYFAVVSNANAVVTAANLTTSAVQVSFDPLNDPIECHLQLSGQTSLGYPFKTFALWAYGNDDPAAARPDMPVLANAAKHGAPHVFTVFEPLAGLPLGPYPATICLHGGGPSGSHWAWAPESIHYANDEATPVGGITVAMDDRVFVSTNGVVNSDRPSNWFGWWPGMSPTSNSVPPNGAVVVPYTLRRLVWTLDWLQTRSTYAIDARRTSVMGNSMGGAGTLLLSRYRPERFSAATSFVPQHYTPDTGQRLFGTPAQNLLTTELGPSGSALRVNDFFDAAVRLSPQQRDYCLTRIFRGRRDTAVDWDQQVLDLYNDMNAGRWGTHLYWDNRDHTASDWTTDDPQTPAVDIGEWVAPVRTQRSGAPYQSRFLSDQSYPAFFDDDQSPASAGRQPALGNGSPDDGTPWGTWGGYFDWDVETIFDTPNSWSCTLFLLGRAPRTVDNFPGSTAMTSLTVRKPRKLLPSSGTSVAWTLRDHASDALLQSGVAVAESSGLVAVSGLVIPKDPQRVRLEFRVGAAARAGDLDADGSIDLDDVSLMTLSPLDLDGDGLANALDVELLRRHVLSSAGSPVVSYCTAGTTTNGCNAVLSASGWPSASATSGFTLTATNVEGLRTGLIFYGTSGRNAAFWATGSSSVLCVKSPAQRTSTALSGGTNNSCSGTLSLDWLAWLATRPGALGQPLASGRVFQAQCWFRDPAAPGGTHLSQGLEWTLAP